MDTNTVDPLFDGRWWRTVARVADVVARSHDYATILASFRSALGVEVAFDGVLLLGIQNGELTVVATAGDATPAAGTRLEVEREVMAQLGRALVRHVAGEDDRAGGAVSALCTLLGSGAFMTIPLLSGGELVGAIAVTRREGERFHLREAALLEVVAPHLAHAVRNVRAQLMRERWSQLLVHDLKSPLAALALNLDLLSDPTVDPDDYVETVRDCRRSVKQLIGMTQDLLDMFQCEEAGVAVRRQVIDLATLVDSVFSPMRHTTARGINLTSAVPRTIALWVDGNLLYRVIDNIVSNAIRYTPFGGSICVDARIDDGGVVIGIENDGTPIDPTVAKTLFHKYGELGDRRTRNRGLGLYVCRLFVEAHGGTIQLVPAEGRSTRFEIRFPLEATATRARGAVG
jgi:signal transduction histidine kinase